MLMQAWLAITLSCSLLIVLVLLLYCLCKEHNLKPPHRSYILDENGIHKSVELANEENRFGFFRRYSNLYHPKLLSDYKNDEGSKELMDSMDIEKQFNNVILCIDSKVEATDKEIDALSCISGDSHNTFYSVSP